MMMRVIMMMMTGVGGRHPGLAEHHVPGQSGPQQGRQGLRVHRGGGEAGLQRPRPEGGDHHRLRQSGSCSD